MLIAFSMIRRFFDSISFFWVACCKLHPLITNITSSVALLLSQSACRLKSVYVFQAARKQIVKPKTSHTSAPACQSPTESAPTETEICFARPTTNFGRGVWRHSQIDLDFCASFVIRLGYFRNIQRILSGKNSNGYAAWTSFKECHRFRYGCWHSSSSRCSHVPTLPGSLDFQVIQDKNNRMLQVRSSSDGSSCNERRLCRNWSLRYA